MAYTEAQWREAPRRSAVDEKRLFWIYLRAVGLYMAPLLCLISFSLLLPSMPAALWPLMVELLLLVSLPFTVFFAFRNYQVTLGSTPSTLLDEVTLPPEGSAIEEFPVMIYLRRNDWVSALAGIDEGMMQFKGGKLSFEGRRTSFAFGRQWVHGVGKSNQSMVGARIVFLSNPQTCLHLEFRLPRCWNRRKWITREFNRQILKWDTALAPTSVSTLPPLSPDPTYVQKLKWAVFCCAPAIAGLGVLGVFGPGHHNFLAPLPMLPATCMTASRYFRLQRLMRT